MEIIVAGAGLLVAVVALIIAIRTSKRAWGGSGFSSTEENPAESVSEPVEPTIQPEQKPEQNRTRAKSNAVCGGNRWTDKDDELVIELRKRGLRTADIARATGRTDTAVAQRLKILRLSKSSETFSPKVGKISRKRWSEDDVAQLIALKQSGRTQREIANELGRTEKAVQNKYREVRNGGEKQSTLW